MAKKIRHSGIITSIEADCIKVQIVQKSACAHCAAAGQCNAAESKEKIVEVSNRWGASSGNASALKTGDEVIVTASQKVGYLAVLYGAVLPFLALVAFTVCAMLITGNEPLSALIGIGAMAVYFCALYFFRNQMKSRLAFEIERN